MLIDRGFDSGDDMKHQVNIVVTCTKRKRLPPAPDLRLGNVHAANIIEGFSDWVQRLSTSKAQPMLAKDIYVGEHWSIVRALESVASSSGLQASVWVCSAGYGLITLDTKIKPYSATFSPDHADTICKWSAPNLAEVPGRLWWRLQTEWKGLDAFQPRSIKDIAAKYPESPVLVVASQVYLKAILDDVRIASKTLSDTELLCIISTGTNSLPSSESNLLPCSAVLQTEEGGSLNSLNVRLARTILTEFREKPIRVSALRAYLAARVAMAPPLQQYNRNSMTNDEVLEYILKGLRKDPKASWSSLLRRLRDSGQACSQERFASLFQSVRNRMSMMEIVV